MGGKPKEFDPFEDRLSRDVRNQLSHSFRRALKEDDYTPFLETAERFRSLDPGEIYEEYIRERLDRYRKALETIRAGGMSDPWQQGLVLWDLHLFFEVHEIFEEAWLRSSEAEKNIYQAMVRAAGMYIKLKYGNSRGARKMAEKAADALERHRDRLPENFEVDLLLDKLRSLDPVPPKLFQL